LSTKRNGNGSKQSQSSSLNRVDARPSVPKLEESEVLNAHLNVTADRAEELAWHMNPESLMESGALEG